MSFQPQQHQQLPPTLNAPQQQIPLQGINSYLPNDSNNRQFPSHSTALTNGLPMTPMSSQHPQQNQSQTVYAPAMKQQFMPHQHQQPLRQQLHTNGIAATDSSNNSSRTASPAFNQALNSAYLPPTSTLQQKLSPPPPPLPPQLRPTVYDGLAGASVPTLATSVISNSLPSPAQTAPPIIASSIASSQQTPSNSYPNSVAKQGASAGSSNSTTLSTTTTMPIVPNVPISQANVDKVASNLQNIHLNNGNGNAMPIHQYQQQPAINKLTNGNPAFLPPTQSPLPQQQTIIANQLPARTHPPPQAITTPSSVPSSLFGSQAPMNSMQQQRQLPIGQQQLNGPSLSVANQIPKPTPATSQFQTQYSSSQPVNLSKQLPPMVSNNNNQSQQLPNSLNANNNMHLSQLLPNSQQQPQQQLPLLYGSQPPMASQFAQSPNLGVVTANSTVGKRPLYPSQQQQQPAPCQQMQQYNNGSAYYNQPNSPIQQQPLLNQYQQQQQAQQNKQYDSMQPPQQYPQQSMSNNIVHQGFNSMWGHNTIDLMQQRQILPTLPVEPPKISLDHQFYESVNCSPDIMRCTLTKIPESNSLLQKSRLPLGILIHPFRDLNNLPVIQCSTIVRCRSCRTYINPFVYFVDSKKWKCNLCFRINELPDEFQYDPVSKSYGDVTRRPEVKSSTIEFIAPSEYMLRPPQPAIYLFLLDVSHIAQQSGYLRSVCESLTEHLESMPGDARTQIGFIAFDSAVHFYSLAEGFNQPHEITVVDIEDPFLPCPDNLLISLNECKELIKDLLTQLPTRFGQTHDTNSALGAALQVAFKLMHQTGGRVTVFQTCLPNIGPGALQSRENPNERSAKDIHHLGPATDFYKRQALECSGQQIAVDLFLMNSQYSDLATISGISKFSGGCIHHFPLFNAAKPQQVDSFKRCFERYLTRKIGLESVMRIRCTRGLAIHTFHGNFFVRSTDLLSLPNVNPDSGYGMQLSYDENLGDSKTVCFQAALLYTSSKGERRIRVHTLCLPVSSSLTDVIYSADAQAIIGLISKMAVDRSLQSSISDARDAFINASCDIFSAFHSAQNIKQMSGQLVAPTNLTLLPLYMLALLKHTAFRTGTSTRLDDRVFAMCELKTLPLDQLIRYIYPDLYHLDCLFGENNNSMQTNANDSNCIERMEPPLLQLSAEYLKSRSIFLLDCGTLMLILVGSNVPATILQSIFGVQSTNEIPDLCFELPSTGTSDSENLHSFIAAINVEKPFTPTIQIIRDNSPYRSMFIEKLVDDRSESSLSYYEFLQHLRSQVK